MQTCLSVYCFSPKAGTFKSHECNILMGLITKCPQGVRTKTLIHLEQEDFTNGVGTNSSFIYNQGEYSKTI